MKILFVLENYLPHIGGVEIVFKNLCEGLARKGHDVTLITHRLPGTKREEKINGVKVVRVRCLDSRYLFTFAAIPTVLKYAKEADVIHTTTYNGAPPAWLAARLRGKKVIITVHETWMGKWKEYTDFNGPKLMLHELLERMVFLPRYDEYVCVSKSTAKQLAVALPKQKNQITTIYNGFDDTIWKKRYSVGKLRKKFRLQNKFVIFAYGRPGTSKGFQYLLDAFPLIKKKIPNAILYLMLSTDKQYAHVVERMKNEAPSDVVFLKPQPYKDIPQYLQLADCVVVPSLTEGFGYTTIEASASGTPVVASNTTSIPEVIYGKYVLVKPKSASAIADGVVKARYGGYDIHEKKSFPWSRTIREYEREYKLVTRTKR